MSENRSVLIKKHTIEWMDLDRVQTNYFNFGVLYRFRLDYFHKTATEPDLGTPRHTYAEPSTNGIHQTRHPDFVSGPVEFRIVDSPGQTLQ